MRLRVFAGSSGETVALCRAVQAQLEHDLDVTVWNQDVFRPTYGALDSLLEQLESSSWDGSSAAWAAIGPSC
jgi:predicted nucleotide-binding protein